MTEPILRRSINLPSLVLYGLGTMIGAGIYVLIGRIAGHAGLWTPLVFVLAALLALPSAWSYSQLSKRLPQSAGEAAYIQHAFNRQWLSRLTGIGIILTGLVSAATLSRGLVGYFQVFFPLPVGLIISGFVILCTAIACWGVRESVALAVVITLVEVCGLILVTALCWPALIEAANLWQLSWPTSLQWKGIAVGVALAFYSFIGFEDMVNMAEEVKRPERNLPRGIMLALALASVGYLVVALAVISALPPEQLANSDAPFASLAESAGYSPKLITLISLIAIINGAMVQLIMASRVLYGMARQQLLPGLFGWIHPKRQTPIPATLISAVLIWLLAMTLPLEPLARLTSGVILAIFALVNLALMVLYSREQRWVPLLVPLLGVLCCSGFLLWQLF